MAKAERENARRLRKRQLAEQQANQFEDELSAHELNIARLEAIPQAQRDEGWESAKKSSEDAIATLTRAVETTLAEAESIGDDGKVKK